MKLLVVDGNPTISEVLSSYMRLLGHEVDEAGDGREAIRQLQINRHDIVICVFYIDRFNFLSCKSSR